MTSIQTLAEIAARRAASYQAGDVATEELRAAAETALERISELNSRGAANQFQLLCRTALIELRSVIGRDERLNIDLEQNPT
jgi:hypothetical protein